MTQVAELLPPQIEPVAERSSPAALLEALRSVAPISRLKDSELLWLAENGVEVRSQVGQLIFREGDPATYMSIILQGEIMVTRGVGASRQVFTGRARELTGLLPHSRMKAHGGQGITTEAVWALLYPRSLFPEMLRAIPDMSDISTGVLLDRVREVTRMEQQTEKLNALNQLAGNLAHELNNPASAAQRSAAHLHGELHQLGNTKVALGALCLSPEQTQALQQWAAGIEHPPSREAQATLDVAEREAPVLDWLHRHDVSAPWEMAAALAEVGATPNDLERLTSILDARGLSVYLQQFVSERRSQRMADSIQDATQRIFRIIDAIKDYAYLDQAAIQAVSIPQALRTTLTMLHSRMARVEVVEAFAPDLPLIDLFASEMNQVWMALLENALDAIEDHGRIELRAYTDGQSITVEIIDDGPGISDELCARIFEPFFSTKGPGPHLGLGLDIVQRIVRKHRGTVTVTKVPQGTCFQVRLPLDSGRAY